MIIAIKKLQNNYTTLKQSKRLLELGLPADSADCYYDSWKQIQWRQLADLHNDFFDVYKHYTPCWSVGRLIEIWLHCNKFSVNSTYEPITIGLIDFSNNFIDDFIHLIKKAVSSKHIDFSKLEE